MMNMKEKDDEEQNLCHMIDDKNHVISAMITALLF